MNRIHPCLYWTEPNRTDISGSFNKPNTTHTWDVFGSVRWLGEHEPNRTRAQMFGSVRFGSASQLWFPPLRSPPNLQRGGISLLFRQRDERVKRQVPLTNSEQQLPGDRRSGLSVATVNKSSKHHQRSAPTFRLSNNLLSPNLFQLHITIPMSTACALINVGFFSGGFSGIPKTASPIGPRNRVPLRDFWHNTPRTGCD